MFPLFESAFRFLSRAFLLVAISSLCLSPVLAAPSALQGTAAWVDPMIGAAGGGNVFPGPTHPFGMVKPGPDMGGNGGNAGWEDHTPINGFSQLHVSGTGGGAKYGNIMVMPTTGKLRTHGISSEREQERAQLGYYAVKLKRFGIETEITAAPRAAIYRFTYPQTEDAHLIFDLAHCLSSSAAYNEAQSVTGGTIKVISPHEVVGSQSVTGGWNIQTNSYTVYFYARTDVEATSWGTFVGDQLNENSQEAASQTDKAAGAWLTFPTQADRPVHFKIGVSFISVDQAKENAATIEGFDFARTEAAVVATWLPLLEKVELTGASDEQRRMFTTAIYHTLLMPADRTGENPLWESREPYYDDYYAIWDTFRTSSPLITLLDEPRQASIVRAMVDLYRHEGWMPDARSGNFNGRTQGGSDGDVVVADALVKNLPNIDWETAFQALVKNAEVTPEDQFKEGRGGLSDWHTIGYLCPEGVDRPCSKTMEYALNDFAVATVAEKLGKQEEAKKYYARSRNWENIWNDKLKGDGFKGFVSTRHRDGSWKKKFNVNDGGTWHSDQFYEGNSWIYSFFVPHDVARLIEKCGGEQRFVERLDWYFDHGKFDVTNEPGFLSPYLYLWTDQASRTAKRVRQVLADHFHPQPNGIPGNDDSGAMSSLYAFGLIGLMPNAGQDVYLIGSPQLPEVTLHLSNGKTFRIVAENVSPTQLYVGSATLNGQPLDRAWLRHGEIMAGGELRLQMTAQPTAWGTKNFPPSLSTTQPPAN